MSVAAVTVAALLATASPDSPAMAARTPAVGDVQQAMQTLAATPGVVGAIGGAYVDGRPAGSGTAGSRLLGGKGGPIPVDSRFRIASQTKMMTCTVLLQFVKEGRLGLNDKLADLLPEVAVGGLVERADEITVQQLVQHTSGIPDWFYKSGTTEPAFDVFDFTTYHRPIDIVKMTRGLPRTGGPGEKFTYSNTNYTLIGMIIEKVTGHTLAGELDRRLFHPLGMTRTYMATKPPQGIKGPHGHGYYPDPTGAPHDVHRYNAGFLGGGAGGVVSTTQDVSTFWRAFTQGRLLPPSLQEVLTRGPQPSAQLDRGPCEEDLQMFGGDAPGSTTLIVYSTDGRQQLEISVTRSTADDDAIIAAMAQAGQAVLCPAA
jgi:D-alanyl-D-alanine carboxypeptidase